MRARLPDRHDTVDRDGVGVAFDVYENDAPTLLLMPSWAIVDSRVWKAQIAYLARHWRVVTFDPRGNGASDRPVGRHHYTDEVLVGDALAVLDATRTDRAALLGLSRGGRFTALLAARHPERVTAMVLIAPSIPLGPHPRFSSDHLLADVDDAEGWEKFNIGHWLRDWPDFVDFFINEVFVEPHSTKPIEDSISYGLCTDGDTIARTMHPLEDPDAYRAMLRSVDCPVLVVQGTEDTVTLPSWGEEVASLTGGELLVIEGGGHAPNARDPVVVNRAIHDFLRRAVGGPPEPARRYVRSPRRPRRVLYLSSPIGLGHVGRDLAIARGLRQRVDGLEIAWLAQPPVTRVLDDAGETVHPASRWLASESAHLVSQTGEHDLHVFRSFRDMDEILLANFLVFQEVVEDGQYDLVVADEAWDVDHFWHEHPELKRAPMAWMTDFVGFLPMPDGGPAEVALTADYNAEMLEHVERARRVRDRAIFVGDPEDVVSASFGPGLPRIREWTSEHFAFAGYISGFDPAEVADREALRARLGYGADERICVVTVGGSGVGEHLLRRVSEAHRIARQQVDGLRTVVVTGPEIDPAVVPRHDGLDVRSYVPALYRHLAASDLAVVQGGLTTTMELVAARRPFVYFPLKHHFEQQIHVRHRLDRYRAGRCMDYDEAEPDVLADAIASEIGRAVEYRPVATDGADRAADLLAELL